MAFFQLNVPLNLLNKVLLSEVKLAFPVQEHGMDGFQIVLFLRQQRLVTESTKGYDRRWSC
jgi:hypothetical protein